MKLKFIKVFLKFIKVFSISILSIIILINSYIILQTKANPNTVPNVFGYKPFIVMSGSMDSKIKTGDLVVVKKFDYTKLKKEDIIAFKNSENLVITHRIKEVINMENNDICFKTKGDANNTPDKELICSTNIEGKYSFKISKLGTILIFIQKPLGFTIMMMSLFILGMFIYIFSSKNKSKKVLFTDEEELREFEEFKKNKQNNNK